VTAASGTGMRVCGVKTAEQGDGAFCGLRRVAYPGVEKVESALLSACLPDRRCSGRYARCPSLAVGWACVVEFGQMTPSERLKCAPGELLDLLSC
jgi:hypothetical protein